MADAVKPGLGTKGEYARHRGCSAAYVSKLIRLGRLAEPALLADGRVNFILADQMLGAAHQPEITAPAAPASGPNYSIERARREAAQAEMAEMDLERRRGESLGRQAVEEAAFSVFGRATARIFERWPEVAPDLARMTDPALIADRLADETRRAMAGIHQEFTQDAARRSAE